MERRARRVPGLDGRLVAHLQRPWQRGGPTEQLLVEPVAPPPDRLCERQAGGDAGDRHGYIEAAALGRVQPERDAQRDAPGDTEAAFPDGEDAQRVVGERIPRGGHVVQPGTDDAAEHTPHAHCRGIVACARTARLETTPEQPDAGDHAQRNDHPVGVDRERTEFDRAVGRARDRGRYRRGEVVHHRGCRSDAAEAAGELDRALEDDVLVVVLGGYVVAALEQHPLDRAAVVGLQIVGLRRLDHVVVR